MRISKFSDDQIHEILKELRRDSVSTVAQRHGVSQQTIYLWKKRIGRDTDTLASQLEAELVGCEQSEFHVASGRG